MYELMLDNAKMQIHCNDEAPPDRVIYRLDPTAVDNFPRIPDNSLIEYGDVWNDSSDSTSAPTNPSDPDTFTGARGVLNLYTGGELLKVTLHFRASATGDNDLPIVVELDRNNGARVLGFAGGSSLGDASKTMFHGPGYNWDIPNDGVIRNYSVDVTSAMLTESGWDDLDELRDDLANNLGDGPCWLYFWVDSYYDDATPFPDSDLIVYESWIIVEAVS